MVSLISMVLGSSCLVSKGMESISISTKDTSNDNALDKNTMKNMMEVIIGLLRPYFRTYLKLDSVDQILNIKINMEIDAKKSLKDYFESQNNTISNRVKVKSFDIIKFLEYEDYKKYLNNVLANIKDKKPDSFFEAIFKSQEAKSKFTFGNKLIDTLTNFDILMRLDLCKILNKYLELSNVKHVNLEIESPKFEKPYSVICYKMMCNDEKVEWRLIDPKLLFKGMLIEYIDFKVSSLRKKYNESSEKGKYLEEAGNLLKIRNKAVKLINYWLKYHNISKDCLFRGTKLMDIYNERAMYGDFKASALEYFEEFVACEPAEGKDGKKGSIKTDDEEFRAWCIKNELGKYLKKD